MPLAVLPARVVERADVNEAELLVQRDAGVVGQRDAGDRRAKPTTWQLFEQRIVETAAEAAPNRVRREIHADLGRPVVRGTLAPWSRLRVTDHALAIACHEPRMELVR